MPGHRDGIKLSQPHKPPGSGKKTASKKPYSTPVLIEYGTVAKLTQGTRTQKSDGGNFRRNPMCL